LHRSSKNVCVWGHGSGDAFIVGEAPGEAEARTGRPFMGKSGRILRNHLDQLGLSDAYITNVAKCRPPRNRKPEPFEIKACRPYIEEEIAGRNPRAILLLGATALKAFVGKVGITEMNGQVIQKNGRTFVAAFHPAYILRDPSKEKAMAMAFGRYAAVLQGTYSEKLPEYRVVDRDSIKGFIYHWTHANVASFDTETTGLDWWKDDINTLQISMPSGNWVLPLAYNSILDDKGRRELLAWMMHTQPQVMYAQNGKFDNLFLMRRYRVRFRIHADTMLLSHMWDENAAHGLKNLARTHCGAPDYDLTVKQKTNPENWEKFFGYGAADAHYTRLLVPVLEKKLDPEETWLFRKVIMPAARAFEEIEENGMWVHLDKMKRVELDTERKLEATRETLHKMARRRINWNAPEQVADVLFNQMKLIPYEKTPKGVPSTSELALSYHSKHSIVKQIEEYRKLQKFLSTYIVGWREHMDGPRLYLGYKLHGTVTGRFSSRIHQVPRDGTIRNLIDAPAPWTFFQLDLAQAELKIIAMTAREPEMLRCFREGIDIHWRTLMAVLETGSGEYIDLALKTTRKKQLSVAIKELLKYGPDVSIAMNKEWKEARKKAKGINFGLPYGQGTDGFIDFVKAKYDWDPPREDGDAFRNTFFATYPGLPAWHERQKNLVRQDGFVRNMAGRKRNLPGIFASDRQIVAECERQAINAPIQGFIGDYKTMILVEIHETIPHVYCRIVGEVHDSILGWVRTTRLNETLREVKRIADNPKLARECGLKFAVPLTVDIEVGAWGAGKRWRP